MSETMQACHERYRSSRAKEGRLKLSTSCTECHRRKQKCDRKRPCRTCTRRFPQVACIYRTLDNSSITSPIEYLLQDRTASSSPCREVAKITCASEQEAKNSQNGKPAIISYYRKLGSLYQDFAQSHDLCSNSVDLHDPSTYQQLLTTMVSRMSGIVEGKMGSHENDLGFFEDSNENSSRSWDRDPFIRDGSQRMEARQMLQKVTRCPKPSSFSITSVDPLHYLGVKPVAQSSELLQAFVNQVARYVTSIDGRCQPNYYNDVWVPWSMKSPLLANLAIFTASCYQAEAYRRAPKESPVVLRYKCDALTQLNGMLSNKDTSTSNEVIGAIIILIINEWYWSGYEVVQGHLNGLKEIVRLRVGLGELGMSGFLRRMILLTDYQMAISYKQEPTFPHNVERPGIHPVHMNSPFIRSRDKFSKHIDQLDIRRETAALLDDMRSLLLVVLNHVDREMSLSEKNNLTAASIAIKDRIFALPSGTGDSDPLAGDYIYKSCRIAALIYCKAIVEKVSLSKACTLWDLDYLWVNMWKIRLARWKQIPGIFLFVILAALPAAQDTAHGRFLKSTLKTTAAHISIDNWNVVDNCLMAHIKLSRWLRAGAKEVIGRSEPKPLEFVHMYEC